MDETRALAIVTALADGVDPLTGETFPANSPYQTADVVRALFIARRALEAGKRTRTRLRSDLPNVGKPWSDDEDRRLLAAFDGGGSLQALAQAHGRTPAGIQARLEKHSRLEPSYRSRGMSGNSAGTHAGEPSARP